MTNAGFEVVKELIGRGPVFGDADADVLRSIYHALLDDLPVTVDSIAARTERPASDVERVLAECNVVYDGEELVGFGGLSRVKTPHAFKVGQRQRYTWCAWDPLFIAPILDIDAHVETVCPRTRTGIRLAVSSTGIRDLRPASAVLSMRIPDASCRSDIVGNFCNVIHLFASRDAAEQWIGERSDILVLTPDEGFALGTVVVSQRSRGSVAERAEA